MISRVAENCWWMMRYAERSGAVARLLRVHHSFLADVDMPLVERWMPLVIVAGERERFIQQHSEEEGHDGEIVQEYMAWEESNPASIFSSVRAVRENARTVREVISSEMWESINGFWHWLSGGQGRRLFRRARDEFYRHVSEASASIYGVCLSSMLHETSVKFMLLGMWLERASQTARILDVKHHALRPTRSRTVSAEEMAQWSVILQCLSASEPFQKRNRTAPSAANVAGFLIFHAEFPRSIMYSLMRAEDQLRRLHSEEFPEIGAESRELLEDLLADLRSKSINECIDIGIHDVLTEIVDNVANICSAVQHDFFTPAKRVDGLLLAVGELHGVT
jgi:uncharacterized alpha-E superfamily protein